MFLTLACTSKNVFCLVTDALENGVQFPTDFLVYSTNVEDVLVHQHGLRFGPPIWPP